MINTPTLSFEISASSPEEAEIQLNKWLAGFVNQPAIERAEIFVENWEEQWFTRIAIKFRPATTPNRITRKARIIPLEGENELEITGKFLDPVQNEGASNREMLFSRSISTDRDGKLYAEAVYI